MLVDGPLYALYEQVRCAIDYGNRRRETRNQAHQGPRPHHRTLPHHDVDAPPNATSGTAPKPQRGMNWAFTAF